MTHVRTAEPVGTAAVRSALDVGGLTSAEIQSFGSDTEYVVRARLDGEEDMDAVATAVRGALDAGLGDGAYER